MRIISLLGFVLCSVFLTCSRSPIATGESTGTNIGNAKIQGTILMSNGDPAVNTRVVLLPADFNPAITEIPDSLADTTDKSGSFEVQLLVTQDSDSQIPTFNIEAVNSNDGTCLLIKNISAAQGDTVSLEPDTLKKPGSIRVELSQTQKSPHGYIYIPGTSRYLQLDQGMIDSGYALLDSVPAGTISQLLYSGSDSASQTDTLATDFEVVPDSTTFAARTATYVVSKALATPVINGDLSEYSLAAPIVIRDTIYSAQCTIRILWDDSALYIGAKVKDSLLNVKPGLAGEQLINMDDAIEVMLDPNEERGDFLAGDDVKFYVNVLSRRADAKFQDTTWNSSWKTSVACHGTVNDNSNLDTGYTVEIAIPWSDVLQLPPTSGKQLVFDIVLDNDNGFVDEWTQTPWSNNHYIPNSQWVNIPKFWGKLILQ